MSKIQHVAVAGAAGLIGAPVVQALLNANFTVTALVRPGSKSTLPSGVQTANVDFDDPKSLVSALKDQDAVVSTVGSSGILSQKNLFEAAIEAGVKRLIPSEYGCDLHNPKARKLPVFGNKVQIQEFLEEKTKGTSSSYTYVYNSAFLDGIINSGLTIDLRGKGMELVDGGEVPYTTTPLAFIGEGVVRVLQHPDQTANRAVRLHGTSVTQKKLLALAQQVVGEEGWQVTQPRLSDFEQQAFQRLKDDPSDVHGWALPMLRVALLDESYGSDFSKNNDNALLGLKALSDEQVMDVIRANA